MTRKAVAEYVAEMAATLARLAQAAQLHELAYLLNMAAQEAANTALRESG